MNSVLAFASRVAGLPASRAITLLAVLSLCPAATIVAAVAVSSSKLDQVSFEFQPSDRRAQKATEDAWAVRCRTQADYLNGLCIDSALPQAGSQVSLTDYGVGGTSDLDGVTQVYVVRLTHPDGLKETSTFNKDEAQCPNRGYRNSSGRCTWDMGATVFLYPHRKEGAFKLEWLKGPTVTDATVYFTATGEFRKALIETTSGDGQTGALSDYLPEHLVATLKDFEGRPVGFPINSAQRPITFVISGPGGASGHSVTESIEVPANGRVEALVRLGDKAGLYTITASHVDATSATFRASASADLPPQDDPNKEQSPGKNRDPLAEAGDPITVTTGNNYHEETDIAPVGLSPIEFRRAYNSLGVVSRMMGNAWTTTFDRYVLPPTAAGQPTRIRRPDGRTIRYHDVGGTLTPGPQFLGRLTRTATGWRYVDADQTIEEYDSSGRWKTITDLRGRVMTASWDRNSRLTGVTANTGGSLSFSYNGNGQLQRMTDHTGRAWNYTYDGYRNLTRVGDPDNRHRIFSYRAPNSRYLLTGVGVLNYDPGTNIIPGSYDLVRWEYDAEGRATSNYLRNYSDTSLTERIQVSYGADGTRTVTDSQGAVTTFQTEEAHDWVWLRTKTGPSEDSGHIVNRQFDAAMNVASSSGYGRISEFSNHDSKRQVGTVTTGAGTSDARTVQLTYDPRFVGQPTRIVEPSVAPGRSLVTDIEYDARGLPTRVAINGARPDGGALTRITTYKYEGPFGQLTEIDGPRTDVADITRLVYSTSNNRVIRVTNANGLVLRNNITYTPTGKIATEDRPNGLRLTYEYYPGSDLLKSVAETQGATVRTTGWTYDERRFVASISFSGTGSATQTLAFTYDAAGKLKSVDAGGGIARIEYTLDDRGNVVTQKVFGNGVLKRIASFTHDANNRIDRITQPNSSQDLNYASDGRLESSVDGRNQSTTHEYDALKRLTRTIEPGAIATQYGYDVHDRLNRVTDGNLAVTRYDRDDFGDLVRVDSPDTGVTLLTRNAAGLVTRSEDAKGQVTSYTYDAEGRMLTVDRPGTFDDEIWRYDTCLNGAGRLCRIESGNGEYVAFEYDAFGQVAKTSTPAGNTQYVYTATGAISRLTLPSGRAVLYDYNAGGQVTRVRLEQTNGAASIIADQLTHAPFGPVTGWRFGNGLLHTRSVDQQYWPREIATAGVASQSITHYDGNGNPTGMSVDTQPQLFGYSAQDRLETAVGPWGDHGYLFDAVGNRLSQVQDGNTTNYQYTPYSNRLDSDTRYDWTLDATGNTTEKRAADGSGMSFEYSTHHRLTTARDLANPATPLGSYRYNALGQRTQKIAADGTTRFVYNLAGQLIAETNATGAITREYVWLSKLPLALLDPPMPTGPAPTYDQILENGTPDTCWTRKNDQRAYGGSYLQCDPDMSTNWSDHVWAYFHPPVAGEYELQVWFISRSTTGFSHYSTAYAGTAGGQSYAYSLPHAGLTRGTWVSIGTYNFEARTMLLKLRAGSADAARMILRRPLAPTSGVHYIHADHLGTPRAVSNQAGQKEWSALYAPFGAATVNEDPDGDGTRLTLNLRFPGQYFDAETGLHYNYFRTYDPSTGRYLESDPIGLAGGLNSFAYGIGNPVSYSDRLGLEVDDVANKERKWRHCNFSLTTEICTPSSVAPSDFLDAIRKILSTDIGRRVFEQMNDVVTFARLDEPSSFWWGADGNTIYYHPELPASTIPGDGLDSMTLDAALFHEIGHTSSGAAALGQTPGEGEWSQEPNDGGVNYIFTPNKPEEYRAVRYYENPYRREVGLPLRRSYFSPNDVPMPLIGE